MRLNLHEIIDIPGASVPFECELDTERLDFASVKSFVSAPKAKGEIKNSAGLLTLNADITAEMVCVCDRCGGDFETLKEQEVEATLASDMQDEENPDIFPIEGDTIDLSEVLETCFILDMETKFLCSEDCAGLCGDCGANLNLGKCACKAKIDPRMAVLGQLLDNKEE